MSSSLTRRIDVRYVFTNGASQKDLTAWSSVLSHDEQAAASRFVRESNRRDYMAAHALTRRALSQCAPVEPAAWQFATNRAGKPSVAPASGAAGLSFSLSHTDGLVACAVTHGAEVGVDVELTGRKLSSRDIAKRYFSPSEARWLDQAADQEYERRFLALWTLKEACLKAQGTGLGGGLESVEIAFEADQVLATLPEPHEWRLLLAEIGTAYLAVAGHVPDHDRVEIAIHQPGNGAPGASPRHWSTGTAWRLTLSDLHR